MFLLRLGTTGVHRTDLRILPETQRRRHEAMRALAVTTLSGRPHLPGGP